jgi:hypothetical protein
VVEAATAVGALLLPSWVVAILFGQPPDSELGPILARFIGGSLLALSVMYVLPRVSPPVRSPAQP